MVYCKSFPEADVALVTKGVGLVPASFYISCGNL